MLRSLRQRCGYGSIWKQVQSSGSDEKLLEGASRLWKVLEDGVSRSFWKEDPWKPLEGSWSY